MGVNDVSDLGQALGREGLGKLIRETTRHAAEKALPDFYYDSSRGGFWMPNSRHGWVSVNEASIKRELKGRGVSPRAPEGSYLSPLDEAISRIQRERDVAYAGPLAGYKSGILDVLGNRVLVTSSPRLIEPKPGRWNVLKSVFEGLLADPDHNQLEYLFGWIKVALACLYSNKRQCGQGLVIAGPRGSGKSLLQQILTVLYGGRAARPYRYMRNGTEFNADLFGAEHLIIEDEEAAKDLPSRRYFGTKIKELTVNSSQSCHPKHRQAIDLTPFWRLSISLNDEPENLMVLPPIDESLGDKLIILRAQRSEMPMPTDDAEDQQKFWNQIVSELPAFVSFLQMWEIPERLRSPRFGITHFHHPRIIEALGDLTPENKLLNLIDAVVFAGTYSEPWQGSALELERELCRDATYGREAQKLFSFYTACGVYLSRLQRTGRVKDHRTSDGRTWIIYPPGDEVRGDS